MPTVPIQEWLFRGFKLDLSVPKIMAVLNLTPDSFSDGGCFNSTEIAINHAKQLIAEGADILDIGAESTRPGYIPLSSEDELIRLLPVLTAVSTHKIPISIDTYKAKTAEAALKLGAVIINDIYGLSFDPDMARVVADYQAGLVIMHNRADKDDCINIVDDMIRFFEIALNKAIKAGILSNHIVLDVGIGFGKTQKQNLQALKAIPIIKQYFKLPILVGASRKSFINAIHTSVVTARIGGTLAAHLNAVQQGVELIRVHDVASHVQALAVERAITGVSMDG